MQSQHNVLADHSLVACISINVSKTTSLNVNTVVPFKQAVENVKIKMTDDVDTMIYIRAQNQHPNFKLKHEICVVVHQGNFVPVENTQTLQGLRQQVPMVSYMKRER